MIKTDSLSLGLIFPLEGYTGGIPTMKNQLDLAQLAEKSGFYSLWVRDVPLYSPSFGDAGQMYDPWIYLTHIAAHTRSIKLGTASAIIPLSHPVSFAKRAASIDVLYPDRLHLGVASGDRAVEYPAFNVEVGSKGVLFREGFETIRKIWDHHFPIYHNQYGILHGDADVLPKPVKKNIPMYVTGYSGGQPLDWIALHSDGWIYYPQNFARTQQTLASWNDALQEQKQERKPYLQSLYIDLLDDADAPPSPIHLGFRSGRNALIYHLTILREIGVNHVILNMKFASKPIKEMIEELGKEVLPLFQP